MPEIAVTLHAIKRYRERVATRYPVNEEQSARELLLAVGKPLFLLPMPSGAGWLMGCIDSQGVHFTAKLDESRATVVSCGPYWFWHESRKVWRRLGFACSKGDTVGQRQRQRERKRERENSAAV